MFPGTTTKPENDPELLAIEARIAELARTRFDHLREADALTKGLKGFIAGLRGNRDQLVDDAIQTARMCRMEIERLRDLHDRRLAQLDPEKAEELAQIEERQLLLEQAATVRKMGGAQVEMLNRLEAERRPRIEFVESLEHLLFVGDRARLALLEYKRRLGTEAAQLETDALTARMGTMASVETSCAEARESLINFIDKVAVADASMVRIGGLGVDKNAEISNCDRNLDDVRALMQKCRADLDAARAELRPVDESYRHFLAVTTGSPPVRTNRPRYD